MKRQRSKSQKAETEFEVSIANSRLWKAVQPALKKASGGRAVFCQVHEAGTRVRIKGALIDAKDVREIHDILARRLKAQSSLDSGDKK